MIDGHGDDSFRYGTRIRHNFSTNIYSDVDHSALSTFWPIRPQALNHIPNQDRSPSNGS